MHVRAASFRSFVPKCISYLSARVTYSLTLPYSCTVHLSEESLGGGELLNRECNDRSCFVIGSFSSSGSQCAPAVLRSSKLTQSQFQDGGWKFIKNMVFEASLSVPQLLRDEFRASTHGENKETVLADGSFEGFCLGRKYLNTLKSERKYVHIWYC